MRHAKKPWLTKKTLTVPRQNRMSETKTKPTGMSVDALLATVSKQRRAESRVLIEQMQRISQQTAVMWGPSIIGFGSYHYRYASGHEGDAAKIGFSPRKAAISLYVTCDADAEFADELAQLGSGVTHGKGCIYIKKLDTVDMAVLEDIVAKAYRSVGDFDAKETPHE